MDYPNTYIPFPPVHATDYPEIFDPALKQFPRAFRHGEPNFGDDAMESRWRTIRQRVLDHLLSAIAASPWAENLILRGSILMKRWFGEAAREPGDVDWVVQPSSIGIESTWASELFAGLSEVTGGASDVRFDDIRTEDIWTYDRVPGKRIVYYWQAENAPPGSIQMDFVFNETMGAPPIRTTFANAAGTVAFWTATPELSLAWKLQWLDNDMHPQGKDLYDAVLLAEKHTLPRPLIRLAFADRLSRLAFPRLTADIPLNWSVDWEDFQKEYPWVEGEAADWQARLAKALHSSLVNA